ncbi:MAG: ABC transporter permease [Sedimentisphaerales bacterium]
MRTLDILYCAWYQINRRRARTAANILGYAFAVAVMVILTHVVSASKQASDVILNSTGTHFVAFVPADKGLCPPCAANQARTQNGEGFVASGTSTVLIDANFIKDVAAIKGVAQAAPFLQYRLRSDSNGPLFTIGGFDPENKTVVGTTCCADSDIISGRFIGPSDTNMVMLEQAYAKLTGRKTGDTIEIAGKSFSVAGVVNPGIRPAKADVYMLRKDAGQVVARRMGELAVQNPINMILVEVKSSAMQDQVIQSVKNLWIDLVISSYACYKPAVKSMAIHRVAALSLIAVVAISTVLLSMKSQLASLVEQRHDIGILKAVGWADSTIVWQLMTESVLQAAAGGFMGVLAGTVVTVLLPNVQGYAPGLFSNISISPLVLAESFFLGLAGGIAAAVFPAWVAARQCPSQLLRSV